MSTVELTSLRKSYGTTPVVKDLSLSIASGEMVALLGPSGCGKTTTLRMIAGLETPDAGTIAIDGRPVDAPGIHLPPEARGLGMVFQSYAIWPHRTVAQNVEYPLKLKGLNRTDREAKVMQALGWVRLDASKRCSMVAGTTQVCNGTYGNNGWLGLASINITGGTHITQGSAKMNDTYFNTATYNNPNEKLHVECQEVAHTFGLDHQSTDGSSQNSCMDYFSNTGANATSTLSTHPNTHDYDELITIYTHLDSTTTLAASAIFPNAVSAVDGNDPSSWGRLVSSKGRSAIYELDFGGGNKTITFVTWADDSHGN